MPIRKGSAVRHLLAVSALVLCSTFAWAGPDRPVTDDERTKLVAALTAEGCTGGRLKFDDDGYYEVDDAKCTDGHTYDFKFDRSYKMFEKDLEH